MGSICPFLGYIFPTFWSQRPDQSSRAASSACYLGGAWLLFMGSRMGGWLLGQPSTQEQQFMVQEAGIQGGRHGVGEGREKRGHH